MVWLNFAILSNDFKEPKNGFLPHKMAEYDQTIYILRVSWSSWFDYAIRFYAPKNFDRMHSNQSEDQ